MEVGKLKNRVRLQTRTATTDEAGNTSFVFETIAKAWAHVAPMTGVEIQRAGRTEATVVHMVRIRYRKDLTALKPMDRIIFGERTLDIEVVRNIDEANDEMVLECVEVVT